LTEAVSIGRGSYQNSAWMRNPTICGSPARPKSVGVDPAIGQVHRSVAEGMHRDGGMAA
jgi:hypothetical protein